MSEMKLIDKKRIPIGFEDLKEIIDKNLYYVDKTGIIAEMLDNPAKVTLFTRPRRFGKTLNMSMLEQFFSIRYAGKGELFEGLSIWQEEKYRELQGTYPVISLSFVNVKEEDYERTRYKICQLLELLYIKHSYL